MADHDRPEQLEIMILGTYQEMPGLRLNLAQAARLFGAGSEDCRTALDELVRLGKLRMPRSGEYRLASYH